jgi:hypothetical protein
MGGARSTYGGDERCTQGLVGKPEEKRPAGRRRFTWDVKTKVRLQEVERFAWTVLICIRITDSWRALVNTVMKLLTP